MGVTKGWQNFRWENYLRRRKYRHTFHINVNFTLFSLIFFFFLIDYTRIALFMYTRFQSFCNLRQYSLGWHNERHMMCACEMSLGTNFCHVKITIDCFPIFFLSLSLNHRCNGRKNRQRNIEVHFECKRNMTNLLHEICISNESYGCCLLGKCTYVTVAIKKIKTHTHITNGDKIEIVTIITLEKKKKMPTTTTPLHWKWKKLEMKECAHNRMSID